MPDFVPGTDAREGVPYSQFHGEDHLHTTPIIAWRLWVMKGSASDLDSWNLGSVSHDTRWPGQRGLEAVCLEEFDQLETDEFTHPEPAPVLRCTCGIYALKTPDALTEWTSYLAGGKIFVMGEVSLWGKVLKFEQGYRAQFAYPYSLYVLPSSLNPKALRTIAQILKQTYGVDVQIGDPRSRPPLLEFFHVAADTPETGKGSHTIKLFESPEAIRQLNRGDRLRAMPTGEMLEVRQVHADTGQLIVSRAQGLEEHRSLIAATTILRVTHRRPTLPPAEADSE